MSLASGLTAALQEIGADIKTALASGGGGGGQTHVLAQTRNLSLPHDINQSASWIETPITGIVDFLDTSDFAVSGSGIQNVGSAKRVKATVTIKYTVAGTRVNVPVCFYLNGTKVPGQGASGYVRNSSGHLEATTQFTTWVQMATNDTLTVRTRREAGATLTLMDTGECVFSVEAFV